MATISQRNADEQALRRLKQAATRRGVTVERIIGDLLNGAPEGKPPSPIGHRDLDALAGNWTAAEAREVAAATAACGQVDRGLWRQAHPRRHAGHSTVS